MAKIAVKSKKKIFEAEQYNTCATNFFLWKSGKVVGTIRFRADSNEYSVELDDIKGYTFSDWKDLYPLLSDLFYVLKRDGIVSLTE